MTTIKVTTLIENSCFQGKLIAEHGLSMILESLTATILLDTGASPNFIYNANILGFDISKVDYLVISHGHYDHTGGIRQFCEINKKATILLKENALAPKFSGERYVGVDRELTGIENRFQFVDQVMELIPSVFIVPEIQITNPDDKRTSGFKTVKNNELIDDDFSDELFICIPANEELTIISSCSHNGITNICETAKNFFNLPIKRVIGGFHISKTGYESSQLISNYFNANSVSEVFTCHCTGIDQFASIKQLCNAVVKYNSTGDSILI